MGLDGPLLRECLTNPDRVVKSRKYPGHNYTRGAVTCGVAPDKTVVTVVWSNKECWQADLEGHGYNGREYRGQ
jgi:hypothetical protein